jgi:broad specificity phosphatase PhoE
MHILLALMIAAFGAPAPAPGANIYVMRHLNTEPGTRDPDLTAEGARTAAALAGWFRDERPVAIFVTDFRRTRETVAPLATGLGLTPQVYDPGDVPGLVARARAAGGPVLIVGHSNTVGGIVAALGGTSPGELGHDEFGDIWRVAPDGATARARIAD